MRMELGAKSGSASSSCKRPATGNCLRTSLQPTSPKSRCCCRHPWRTASAKRYPDRLRPSRITAVVHREPIHGRAIVSRPAHCALLWWRCLRNGCRINPALGPRSDRFPWKDRIATIPENIWPIMCFLLIIGGLMKGLIYADGGGQYGGLAPFCSSVCLRRDINFRDL